MHLGQNMLANNMHGNGSNMGQYYQLIFTTDVIKFLIS